MGNDEHWALSRVVGRDGRPRTGWHLGMPDEWPEHAAIEAIEVVPAASYRGAVEENKRLKRCLAIFAGAPREPAGFGVCHVKVTEEYLADVRCVLGGQ